MDVVNSSYMPGDPRLIQQLVYELKSQGIFDQFRKECIADVDTKPAYQNLRQRVEGSVTTFLKQQTWRPDMNKNQVREQLRKNIYESGYLEAGVERIVDQVVNPKINTVFLPQVEEVVYRYLGIEKPRTEIKKEIKMDVTDLLPTDLEAVSPESDHTDRKDDFSSLNDSLNTDSKIEEDESPPFEPLEVEQSFVQHEENSVDSHLSGFSGLQSHDSNPCTDTKILELSNHDSQVSHNSSESRLSIIVSEENTKMEICEDSESKIIKSGDSETKTEIRVITPINVEQDASQKETEEIKLKEVDKTEQNKKDDKKSEQKKYEDRKSEKKNEDKKCDEKKHEKYEKKSDIKKSRSFDKHASKDKKDDKKDDKHRKSSGSSSSGKDREKLSSKHSSTSSSKDKDKSKDRKDIKLSSNSNKEKDKNDKEKERQEKEKSDKEKPDKDREKNDKDKNKTSGSSSRHSSSSSTKDKEKSSSSKKDSYSKDKDKSRSSSSSNSRDSKSKSNHSESKVKSADKHKKNDKLSHNDRPSSSSSSSNKKDKDKKRETKKESKDDHYSAKEKKNHRRSTDRDSNDGQSSRHNQSNSLTGTLSSASHSQKSNHESSNLNSGNGSGDSGNSDEIEQPSITSTNLLETNENKEVVTSCKDIQKFKYIKPKFASNFEEARKLMKIRKQLAKLEKQNQLSLAQIEIPIVEPPSVNGISCTRIESIEEIYKVDDLVTEQKTPKKGNQENMSLSKVSTPILQSTNLSKESWEALEARLAQEMSNVNYNSYESPYDDYDCTGYNSITISPRKKVFDEKCTVIKETFIEIKESSETETIKISAEKINEHPKEVTSEKIINLDGKNNMVENNKSAFEGKEDISQQDINEELKENAEECEPLLICDVQYCTENKKQEQVINVVPDKRITKNLQVILRHEQGLNNTLDIDDECRYLEMPSPSFHKQLEFMYKYIEKLEYAIEHSRKSSQNNRLPLKRGRKRKLMENVDLKNNNKAHYEQTAEMKKRRMPIVPNTNSVISKTNKEKVCNSTDISPNDSFSLPLSPAESDKSSDKKEDFPKLAKQKRNNINKNTSSRCQRYSSDDLYKPRPIIPSTRRSRGAKNPEN